MKTDKFEKTIRQKLESISPDFQESDWAKMQNYMQVHTPPTFWQQYSSWLGYAAAASVTAVMASMYIGQLSQNNQLRTDVKSLQGQIAVIKEKNIETSKTDTVYILQKDDYAGNYGVRQTRDVVDNSNFRNSSAVESDDNEDVDQTSAKENFKTIVKEEYNSGKTKEFSTPETADKRTFTDRAIAESQPDLRSTPTAESGRTEIAQNKNIPLRDVRPDFQSENNNPVVQTSDGTFDKTDAVTSSFVTKNVIAGMKTLGRNFDKLEQQKPVEVKGVSEKMETLLTNRLSPKQVRKAWMQSTANSYNIASAKKTEQVTQAENVIPRLNLKVPYRFGGGLEFQKGVQAKTVVGEVLVSKRFSFSAGLSWLKIKQMEFFTEKMFREKNKQDFKQSHPNQVPVAFVVTNINVEPSLVQIPLTVAFRNEMKNDWAIYAGAGANITLKSKEKISYNCLVPSPRQGKEFISDSFERKMDISPVNSVNFSAGIEKTWHPIVIQAEGYIYNYFKPLTPLNQRSGPGFKVKLLYQIGKKM